MRLGILLTLFFFPAQASANILASEFFGALFPGAGIEFSIGKPQVISEFGFKFSFEPNLPGLRLGVELGRAISVDSGKGSNGVFLEVMPLDFWENRKWFSPVVGLSWADYSIPQADMTSGISGVGTTISYYIGVEVIRSRMAKISLGFTDSIRPTTGVMGAWAEVGLFIREGKD